MGSAVVVKPDAQAPVPEPSEKLIVHVPVPTGKTPKVPPETMLESSVRAALITLMLAVVASAAVMFVAVVGEATIRFSEVALAITSPERGAELCLPLAELVRLHTERLRLRCF